ncbi:MAG: tetratricopeptide repeat protein [Methyloprofundus sp.]|nr:tetratricopeptide repeat protein [Methyloprofundus sp.]
MMVLKLMIAVSFFMLTACATKDSGSLFDSTLEEKELKTEVETLIPERKTEISSEVLFLLMTAEIAGQREQYELALDGYLRASRQVKDPDVIKRAAKIALYLQDDARLKQTLDLWLEVEPESLDARSLQAIVALKSGDRQGALDSIDFILRHDAQDFDSKAIVMLKSLNTQQSVDLAYQVFSELAVKYPEDAQLYFIQALLDVQAKRRKQAQLNITKALELEPDWTRALLLQAQLYTSAGKLSEATEVLQHAVAEQENEQVREQIVQLLIQQGRFEEVEEALQDLTRRYPDNNELKFKLALVYLQTGQEEKARNILQTLVVNEQFRDRAAFYLARMDAKARRFNEALIWFDAIESEPFKFEAGMSAVLILMDQKRYEIALDKIKNLKNEYPQKRSDLILIESEIYAQQGLNQQGFDVLSSGLIEDPDNIRILYARALLAEKLGKLQVLEDDLQYILEKNPNDANALNALGYTLADRTERYEEAKIYLDKAIAIKPDEPIIMDSYGWLLFKLNQLDEALLYLQAAYDKQPQAEIASHLVEVLWALQETEQAKALLAEALARHPDDKLLLDVKSRLLGAH